MGENQITTVQVDTLVQFFLESRRKKVLEKQSKNIPFNRLDTMASKYINKRGKVKRVTGNQAMKFLEELGKLLTFVMEILATKKEIIAKKNKLFKLAIRIPQVYPKEIAHIRIDEISDMLIELDAYMDDLTKVLSEFNYL